jgi:hypothetical protein
MRVRASCQPSLPNSCRRSDGDVSASRRRAKIGGEVPSDLRVRETVFQLQCPPAAMSPPKAAWLNRAS